MNRSLSALVKRAFQFNRSSHTQPLLFTASSMAISASRIIAGIFIVKAILPEELGLWHSARLALTYALILLLGVNNGLNRELPYFYGKQDESRAKLLTAVCEWQNRLGAVLALFAGGLSWLYLYHSGSEENLLLAVAAVTLLIAGMFYRQFMIYLYQSTNSFQPLSHIQFVEAGLMILTIPLLFWYGYQGMLARILMVLACVVILLHTFRPLRVRPRWDRESFRVLVKTGLPIFLLEYLLISAETADRLVLLHFADVTTVGYYGLAAIVYSTFSAIPVSLGTWIYPRLSYRFGQENEPQRLWQPAWRISVLLIVVMLPLAALGWFIIPPVVNAYFSAYAPGIEAAQIMLFATAFSGGAAGAYALWSLKAWRWLITYQVSLALFVVLLPYLGAGYFASPLVGVAAGLLAARFLSMLSSLGCTYFATHGY